MARISAAETAWVFLDLLRVARGARRAGFCLGEIRVRHLELKSGALTRLEDSSKLWALFDLMMASFHEKFMHDQSCIKFGISHGVIKKVLNELCETQDREYIYEALRRGFAEITNDSNSVAVMSSVIVQYITPLEPGSLIKKGGVPVRNATKILISG